MMILGFDKAVANMEVGQIADVHLEPSEAYGEADPDAIFTVEVDKMPGGRGVGGRTACISPKYVRTAVPCKSHSQR